MTAEPARILVIDDEATNHAAYRRILTPPRAGAAELDALDAAIFGGPAAGGEEAPAFEVDCASQGREGLEMLVAAAAAGRPYAAAFVDMRMPPGWDGAETVEQLWKADPMLEVVVCTAYSGEPWEKTAARLGRTHRLLLLRKPFEAAEVWQLAMSLTRKREAEESARAAAAALETANARLTAEIETRRSIEGRLKYDALTSLPNRLLLQERAERCVERSRREPSFGWAVLFIDLDDFKAVNDTMGHAMGDALLVEVGRRLKGCLRSLDTSVRATEDVPARLGGDEFVVLLDGVHHEGEVRQVADRIREVVGKPFRIAGRDVRTDVSIGYATATPDHQVADDVLRDADAALYEAKGEGKGRVRAFDESMRRRVLTKRRLGADIPGAAAAGQLRLLYQPITLVESGELDGFEALVRWEHPELGVVSPALFIPVAEETGAIRDLGLWVLRESLRQLRIWREEFTDQPGLSVSVNVSGRQLDDPGFAPAVTDALREAGLPGSALNLEITETVFIEDMDRACAVLGSLRERGVKLHLDDFGTGYSSLSSFHQLPIDAVKIDRSFVSGMGLDGRGANIVQAIQVMASNRSLKVIAEGVETPEQFAQLQALGCTCAQGYLISRPVDPVAARALLGRSPAAAPCWTLRAAA